MKVGFCLEGGGMRGCYTAGVLDAMIDGGVAADYLIGVSAGASNGLSYLSSQRGRGLRVNVDYLDDKRYLGLRNFIATGSVFGMDFLFDEIPNRIDPYDFDAFYASPCEFVLGATDVETGKCVYFGKDDLTPGLEILRASCSIPVFSPMVEFRGRYYLDGGTSDPIPIRRALRDGCDRLLIVLTQPYAYEKKAQSFQFVYKVVFHKYPEMVKTLKKRHKVYNELKKYAFELEKEGRAVVLAPSEKLDIDRFEKNASKLRRVYDLGMKDASSVLKRIRALYRE